MERRAAEDRVERRAGTAARRRRPGRPPPAARARAASARPFDHRVRSIDADDAAARQAACDLFGDPSGPAPEVQHALVARPAAAVQDAAAPGLLGRRQIVIPLGVPVRHDDASVYNSTSLVVLVRRPMGWRACRNRAGGCPPYTNCRDHRAHDNHDQAAEHHDGDDDREHQRPEPVIVSAPCGGPGREERPGECGTGDRKGAPFERRAEKRYGHQRTPPPRRLDLPVAGPSDNEE